MRDLLYKMRKQVTIYIESINYSGQLVDDACLKSLITLVREHDKHEHARADERELCIQVVNSLKWSESYDSGFVNNAAADYNAALADVIEAIKAE